MKIILNGEAREIPPGLSIAGLLDYLAAPSPRVAVEINRVLIPKARHATHSISEGDLVEVVTFVGGG